MKDKFPGYFSKSEDEIKQAWDTSLYVFDANILLNLYRYSSSTSKEFIEILKKLKKRVWLPHRAVEEYLKNRLSVINAQENEYENKIKEMEKFSQAFENTRQHPFVSKQLMKEVNNVFTRLRNELEQNKKLHEDRIKMDDIKESLAEIFDGSVGKPYSTEEMKKILEEGENRFSQKIPPGYKDSNKNINPDIFTEKCRIYGDYILWKQVIDRSKSHKTGIIFVTDDKKEDWWEIFKGKIIGPRPEIIKEFKDETSQELWMYHADRFLELANTNIGWNISDDMVREIREIRKTENAKILNTHDDSAIFSIFEDENDSAAYMDSLNKSLKNIHSEVEELKRTRAIYVDEIMKYKRALEDSGKAYYKMEDGRIFTRNDYIKRKNKINELNYDIKKNADLMADISRTISKLYLRNEYDFLTPFNEDHDD